MGEITPQYLYIMGPSRDGPLKIGVSKDPEKRRENLQTGSHQIISLFWVYPCPMGRSLERLVHRILHPSRQNGEWFTVPIEDAMAALWIASNDDGEPFPDTDIIGWANHIGLTYMRRWRAKRRDTKA